MKHRNYTLAALLAGLFVTTSCSNEEILMTETVSEPNSTEQFRAMAAMPEGTPATRLSLEEKGSVGSEYLEVKWSEDDQFSVFAGAEATTSTPFKWDSKESDQKAVFAGELTPESGTTYYAIYPVTTSTDPKAVALDMTKQDGTLKSEKIYMYSSSSLSNGGLNFTFNHLTSVLKLTMVFPADPTTSTTPDMEPGTITRSFDGSTISDVTFSAVGLGISGTADITSGNVSVTEKGDISLGSNEFTLSNGEEAPSATVCIHLLPTDLTKFTVRVKVGDDYYKGTISKSCTIEKKKYYTAKVTMEKDILGYVMLESGKTVSPDAYDATTAEDKAIGVVAYLYDGSEPENQKVQYTVEESGEQVKIEAIGLVMALTNASNSCQWNGMSLTDVTLGTDYQISSYHTTYTEGYNGYYLKSKVDEATNKDSFTAINNAADFRKDKGTPYPSSTSGWYLPSLGEWMLMLSKDGIGGCQSVNENVMAGKNGYTSDDTAKLTVDNLNNALLSAGENNYDSFAATSTYYWSSSEYNSKNARYVGFGSQYFGFGNNSQKIMKYIVRPILAF